MGTACQQWLRRSASETAGASLASASFNRHQVYVHPCLIDNRPHIVYPRGLQTRAPQLFRRLHEYFRAKGYALKEDQRRGDSPHPPAHERRRWAPILLFITSLVFEGTGLADTQIEMQDIHVQAHQQSELRLISSHATRHAAHAVQVELAPARGPGPAMSDPGAATRILDLLTRHYQRQAADPEYVLTDFKEIADYYSGFPEVTTILASLDGKKWTLLYRDRDWATVATGNAFLVDSARIYFNTRSAAQLKLYRRCEGNPVCIASPADALLHELLHTRSMLVNTGEFLAQGGMSSVLYPYKHEYAVIDAERKLYARMSLRDNLKRPQRYDHTGRFVKAQCPTCVN